MTLYDEQNTLSDDQAVTVDARSENVLKIGPGDFGSGNKLDLDVKVTEAFDNLTSLNVQVQTDDDVAFGSPKTLYESGEIPLADLIVGYKFPIKGIPPGCEDYLSLYYDVTGTTPTVGKIFASLTPHSEDNNPNF